MQNARVMGLRERNKVMMRSRIENAAVDLALSDGYEQVTVKGICDEAGVSTTTFFNYFDSKDAAVLGAPPKPRDDMIEAFLHGRGSLVADLVELLVSVAESRRDEVSLFRRRFMLIKATPGLSVRESEREDAATAALVRHVCRREVRRGCPETAELCERARMTVAIAMTVVQFAVDSLCDRPDTSWDTIGPRAVSLASSSFMAG